MLSFPRRPRVMKFSPCVIVTHSPVSAPFPSVRLYPGYSCLVSSVLRSLFWSPNAGHVCVLAAVSGEPDTPATLRVQVSIVSHAIKPPRFRRLCCGPVLNLLQNNRKILLETRNASYMQCERSLSTVMPYRTPIDETLYLQQYAHAPKASLSPPHATLLLPRCH